MIALALILESSELIIMIFESLIQHCCEYALGQLLRALVEIKALWRKFMSEAQNSAFSFSLTLLNSSVGKRVIYIYINPENQCRRHFDLYSGPRSPQEIYDGGPGLFAATTRRTLSGASPEPPYRRGMPHYLGAQLPGLEGCIHVTSISGGVNIFDNGTPS